MSESRTKFPRLQRALLPLDRMRNFVTGLALVFADRDKAGTPDKAELL